MSQCLAGLCKTCSESYPPPLVSGVKTFFVLVALLKNFVRLAELKSIREVIYDFFFSFWENRAVCCMYCHLYYST